MGEGGLCRSYVILGIFFCVNHCAIVGELALKMCQEYIFVSHFISTQESLLDKT